MRRDFNGFRFMGQLIFYSLYRRFESFDIYFSAKQLLEKSDAIFCGFRAETTLSKLVETVAQQSLQHLDLEVTCSLLLCNHMDLRQVVAQGAKIESVTEYTLAVHASDDVSFSIGALVSNNKPNLTKTGQMTPKRALVYAVATGLE